MKIITTFLCILLAIGVFISCQKLLPKPLAEDEILDGPIEGLTPEQLRSFIKGDVAFNDEVFTAANGLGPLFVANSCASCHAGDGISGRVNWISLPAYAMVKPGAVVRNGKYIGRFGKKAAVYDLLQQTVNAYNQDMGINSTYEHYNTYNGQEADAEISNETVQHVVFYLQTLKAPIQREQTNTVVQSGKQVFLNIGCGKCHTPQMQTGNFHIPVLANKTFYPYSDFLLHDMGNALNDGYTEGTALPVEWRTPPLWGLGLSKNSQGGQYFLLHDGRAKSIEEAIIMHGGEALQSRNAFQQLNAVDKASILKFLESL